MPLNNTTVCNTDLLQSAKFIFSIPRLTATQFFCQAINIPGLNAQSATQPTPLIDLNVPGDKLNYDDLTVEFLVDEELLSWLAVHDWLKGITKSTSFEDYKNLKHLSMYSETVPYPQYADAELTTLSANNTPKTKIKFVDLFPVALSGIPLDIRVGSEHTITATSTFKFKRYDVIKL
jgi:hypothetical protein